MQKLRKAFQVFFHPRSPAAVYRDPRRLVVNLYAAGLNMGLRLTGRVLNSNRVTCNICGWQGRKFGYTAAVSVYYFAADEICLRCGSNRRTRTLTALLAQHVNLTKPELTIIEVGPSSSTRRFFERYPNLRYLTVDRFKEADIHSDVTDIQLSSDSIDVIICCHVLEHIENYKQGMAELFRILKPGWPGLIAVPQTPGLKLSRRCAVTPFEGYGHVWEFGDDFADQLIEIGFQVSTVYGAGEGQLDSPTGEPFHLVSKPQN
jgi:SAM-dependent methyltransferase